MKRTPGLKLTFDIDFDITQIQTLGYFLSFLIVFQVHVLLNGDILAFHWLATLQPQNGVAECLISNTHQRLALVKVLQRHAHVNVSKPPRTDTFTLRTDAGMKTNKKV